MPDIIETSILILLKKHYPDAEIIEHVTSGSVACPGEGYYHGFWRYRVKNCPRAFVIWEKTRKTSESMCTYKMYLTDDYIDMDDFKKMIGKESERIYIELDKLRS